MASAFGHGGGLLFLGEETTYGTAETRTEVVEIISEGVAKDQAILETAGLNALINDSDDTAAGRVTVAGDIGFEWRYEGFEFLVKHALGAVASVQQGATAAYKHTFTMEDALPTGLSMEIDADIKGKLIEGGKINSITFNGEADGFMTGAVGIVGEDLTLATVTTGLNLTTAKLIPFTQVVATWGGSSIDLKSFSVTLANNLAADRYFINSGLIKEPVRSGTRPEITGTLAIDFEGTTQFDDFVAQTTKELVITATGDEIENPYNYEIVLTMSKVILTGATPSLADIGIIPLELPFKAYATDTSIRELKIEIQNTLVSV